MHLFIEQQYFFNHCLETLDFLIGEGLAGRQDSDGNTALHLLEWPWFVHLESWSVCVMRSLEAGETLLIVTNKGETLAEPLLSFLQFDIPSDNLRGTSDERVPGLKSYFMEELSEAEATEIFDDESLDKLYCVCHRLRTLAKDEDGKAEEMTSQGWGESDEI